MPPGPRPSILFSTNIKYVKIFERFWLFLRLFICIWQLCLRDRVLSPWDTRFQDRVCDGDQPAGDGDDDEFVRLAAHFEVLGDWLQNRIVTGGGKCGLSQGMPK